MLIKAIETTGGYPAKVHGGRAQPANGNTSPDKTGKCFERTVRVVNIGVWETCYQARFLNVAFDANMNRLAIKRGAFSFFSEIVFFNERVKHCAHDHSA